MEADNVAVVRRYLKAIETRAAGGIGEFFTPDARFEQLPNRLYPQGLETDLAGAVAASVRGQALMLREHYEVHRAVSEGNSVAAEATWTGTLAAPVGELTAGDTMRAHFAMFFTFRDGRIALQRNYDCFEPF